jgi:hypothetical protein
MASMFPAWPHIIVHQITGSVFITKRIRTARSDQLETKLRVLLDPLPIGNIWNSRDGRWLLMSVNAVRDQMHIGSSASSEDNVCIRSYFTST